METPLLQTKLYIPSPGPNLVSRPRLLERLDAGFHAGKLTLVSAPPGFGKTTCVSEWVKTLDCPVTWLSLDAADDDPGRFFVYFVAALQKVDANLGREIEGALRAGQLPPGEVISTTLINDILAWEGRSLLVLDDFQMIQDRFILGILEKVVANLPSPLYVVLLTREDPPLPLARLRANRQLTEIRAVDLRFTRHEADRFLNEGMGLALSQADIAALEDKTEGWVVGLQLAGLSVRDRAAPSRFIATLSGSHRFILHYLTEQVLDRQPAEIRDFLLQTSILEKLNGDLCDAVTGRADSRVLLERLFNANLFLIPLDDEGQWYRYHHLFADLLRGLQNALQKGETVALHRRGSRWYAQAGMAREAIQHALAAEDYGMAVELLESHALQMVLRGHIKTVEGWMRVIPPEWRAQSPRTNLTLAWLYLLRGDATRASPYVEALRTMFDAQEDRAEAAVQAEWLALQATLLNAQEKPRESLALAHRALQMSPRQDQYVRGLIYLGLADAYQLLDDHVHAADAFQRMARHGRTAENFTIELLGLTGLSALALRYGQLRLAFEMARQGVRRIERSGSLPPISAALYGVLGQVHYQRNQLQEAHRFYQRAVQVGRLSDYNDYNDVETVYAVIRAHLYQGEGDLEASARELQTAVDLLQWGAPAWVRSEVIAQQVRLYLARDDPAAAEMVLRQSGVSIQDEVSHKTDRVHLAYLRLMRYQGQKQDEKLGQAKALARRILASAEAGQRVETTLQALILQALLRAASGDTRGSLESLDRALGRAEPEGYRRVFLDEGAPLAALLRRAQAHGIHPDYVKALLALFPAPADERPRPREMGALVEPLTERELEVLCLLDEGCSNREIARRLLITLHTVKKHNSNIYAKLGVSSRTQAVARARQLGLC